MTEMKKFRLICLVSLLGLGLAMWGFGFPIFDSVSSNPKSNPSPSSIRNPQSAIRNPQSGRPWINLRDGVDLPTTYTGAAELKQVLERGLAQPLALASADFDEDGVPDLVSGYMGSSGGIVTLHRGNLYSIYPNYPKPKTSNPQSAIRNWNRPSSHPPASLMCPKRRSSWAWAISTPMATGMWSRRRVGVTRSICCLAMGGETSAQRNRSRCLAR
jgi:hypothetical protein